MNLTSRPYGEATIVIPFTFVGGAAGAAPVARMSRLRARGALYRDGVVPRGVGGDGPEGAVVLAQYAPASPIPFLPPVFVPGSPANEAFAHSTYEAGRAVGRWFGSVLESRSRDVPPPGSRPIDQTPWSGDHGEIKERLNLGGEGNVRISPEGDVWAENSDGTWTNDGPAGAYTESGESSGKNGKERRAKQVRRPRR